MRIKNGYWVDNNDDKITTPEQQQQFTDSLNRVKQFSKGRRLTHNKITVLFKILDSDNNTDHAMTKIFQMNKKELKNIGL